MTDALDAYLYFHSALVAEARELATILGESLGDDRARMDAVAHRFAFFQQVNAVHEAAEETFLFPAIEKRAPHATKAFAFDHSSGERLYGEIADALDDLRAAERDPPPIDLANTGVGLTGSCCISVRRCSGSARLSGPWGGLPEVLRRGRATAARMRGWNRITRRWSSERGAVALMGGWRGRM